MVRLLTEVQKTGYESPLPELNPAYSWHSSGVGCLTLYLLGLSHSPFVLTNKSTFPGSGFLARGSTILRRMANVRKAESTRN